MGQKVTGGFGLTKTGERRRILVKASDEHARPGTDIVAALPASVRSGTTWEELAITTPPAQSKGHSRTPGEAPFHPL